MPAKTVVYPLVEIEVGGRTFKVRESEAISKRAELEAKMGAAAEEVDEVVDEDGEEPVARGNEPEVAEPEIATDDDVGEDDVATLPGKKRGRGRGK